MSNTRPQFNEGAMERQYNQNVEDAKSGHSTAFGIFNDLPQMDSFRFEAGKAYNVRFIPWSANGDPQKPRWFLEIPVHKFVGPEGNNKNKRDYVCLAHYGQTCPLCNELSRKPSTRYFYNIRVKNDAGVYVQAVVEVNVNFHEALCKFSESTDPDTGLVKTVYFMSPSKGAYVGFAGEQVVKGEMKWVEPGRVGFGSPSAVDPKWMDTAIDLHSHVRLFSAEQLSQALFGNHPEEAEGSALENTNVTVDRVQAAAPVVERNVSPSADPPMPDEEVLPEPIVESTEPPVEPSAPVRRNVQGDLCSKGFPYGQPEHAAKHTACNTCEDAEYNGCVQAAAAVSKVKK